MDEKQPAPIPQQDGQPQAITPDQQEERILHQERVTRRYFMVGIGVALQALVGVAVATPVIAYIIGPAAYKRNYHQWVDIGKTSDFLPGETRLINYRNPVTDPWDGETADLPAYVRCAGPGDFTVFAINCAHLGCPVRWFSESQLFMCPCHGGVYYANGDRAAGPPPRGLFKFERKVENGRLWIKAGQIPTERNKASLNKGPCPKQTESPQQTANLVTRISPCPGTNEPTIG